MNKPKPIYIERKEGDRLEPFKRGVKPFNEVHAIYFADGSEFDVVNGWRPLSTYFKPRVRVPMGRAVI